MADLKNFLNQRDSAFTAEVMDTAMRMRNAGDDDYSSVLLEVLDKARTVALGTAEILNMQRQNTSRRYDFMRGEGNGLEPPLSDHTMGVLSGLAQLACEAIYAEIEETSDWLDTRHRERAAQAKSKRQRRAPKEVQ